MPVEGLVGVVACAISVDAMFHRRCSDSGLGTRLHRFRNELQSTPSSSPRLPLGTTVAEKGTPDRRTATPEPGRWNVVAGTATPEPGRWNVVAVPATLERGRRNVDARTWSLERRR